MNMFNLSAGKVCRKSLPEESTGRNCRKILPEETARSLSVILTGGATDKPCNCSSYIRTPSLKYTNSISQCQIEPAPHLHLTQSCLRLCRVDAPGLPVGGVAVARQSSIDSSARRPCLQIPQWHPGVAKGTSIDPLARGPSTEPLLG